MNQENQIAVNHDHQDPKIPNSDRIRTRTWRFDLTLRVPPLSGQEDVLQVVRSILNKAHDNLAISGLDQSSFSYDVPDGGQHTPLELYLHVTHDVSPNLLSFMRSLVLSWIRMRIQETR